MQTCSLVPRLSPLRRGEPGNEASKHEHCYIVVSHYEFMFGLRVGVFAKFMSRKDNIVGHVLQKIVRRCVLSFDTLACRQCSPAYITTVQVAVALK